LVLFLTGARPNFVDKVIDLRSECGFQPQIAQEVGDAVTGVALVAGGFGASRQSGSAHGGEGAIATSH